MHQFILGTAQAFANLKQQATGRCVRFPKEELPSGATPRFADVGFEIDLASAGAILYVEKGVSYEGGSNEVKRWLEAGCRGFPTFSDLCTWIQRDLASAFINAASICQQCGRRQPVGAVKCRHCGGEVPPSTLLSEASRRMASSLRAQRSSLITGCVPLAAIVDQNFIPPLIAEAAASLLLSNQTELRAVADGEELLLFQVPYGDPVRAASIFHTIRDVFGGARRLRKRIELLAQKRAILSNHRDRLDRDLTLLTVRESELLYQAKSAATSNLRRHVVTQTVHVRHEIAQVSMRARVISQQISIIASQLHSLTVVSLGGAARLPSEDELTACAAEAEELVAQLQARNELAASATRVDISAEDEDVAKLIREIEAETKAEEALAPGTPPELDRSPTREPPSRTLPSAAPATPPPASAPPAPA